MQNWKWVTHRDPHNKYAGLITLGDRNSEIPPDAMISLTRGEDLTIWRIILNGILNQLVMKQLQKSEGLLYAELSGQLQGGIGQTMTIWDKRAMPKFRDKGIHRIAMKFFAWVVHSGKTKTYYLSYPANGKIPTSEEAAAVIRTFGRFYEGSQLVRKARLPE